MNYAGFKKVHEDEEKAILKHKNGSELKIAKKTLKPEHRKALEKLPIYAAEGIAVSPKTEEQKPQQPQSPVNIYVGGNNQQPQQAVPPVPAAPPQPVPQQPQPTLAPQAAQPNQVAAPTQPLAAPPQDLKPLEAEVPTQEGVPQQTEEASRAPASKPNQVPTPQNPEEMMQYLRNRWVQQDQFFANDLNSGHIKPQTYRDLFAKKDTLGKIGTLFGLMVSGAGSGLTKQPNLVAEMMKQEIQNDLDAQQKSADNSQNYLRINQNMQGMQPAAYALAVAQMNRVALHDLTESIQKLPVGSPQRIQAQNALGLLYQAVNNENYNILDRAAAAGSLMHFGGNGTGGGGEAAYRQQGQAFNLSGNEKLNAYRDPRHVPGFGDASIEVPQDVRQELIAKKEYDQAARNYIAFANKHKNNWANLNPKSRLEVAKKGAVLGAELQGKYRLKTHGGVYKQGEQEYIQKIIPDNAASWTAVFNQIPKVQQTIDDNVSDTRNLAKGYGLPNVSWGNQTAQPMKTEKAQVGGHKEGDTGTYNGKPVVFKNGKWAYR